MFGKKKTNNKKETVKKTAKKEVISESVKKTHTPEEQNAFVSSVEKQIKKFFNTKENLDTVIVMAGNPKKNIAVGAGDMDKAIALMYDFTKRMGNDYMAALCGMLLRELTEKEVGALAKTLAVVTTCGLADKNRKLN